MRKRVSLPSVAIVLGLAVAGLAVVGLALAADEHPKGAAAAAAPEWSMNATIIEACSCPMFCQCYFNMEPAAHAAQS